MTVPWLIWSLPYRRRLIRRGLWAFVTVVGVLAVVFLTDAIWHQTWTTLIISLLALLIDLIPLGLLLTPVHTRRC